MQIQPVITPAMPKPVWHVMYENKMWEVFRSGEFTSRGAFITKTEAVAEGIKQARHAASVLVEHSRRGSVQKITNYSAWRGPCELCE